MSLLIKITDDDLSEFIEYEKELIRSVATMNQIWIEKHQPETLCLPCLGVKYKNDGGYDRIEHISVMLKQGFGKCDSVVAWFMAMYAMNGLESEPILVNRSMQELHAQLKLFKDNKVIILDPSINLMKLSKEFCPFCGGK